MAGPFPDSYRRLAHFSSRIAPGARLYDQGAVPDEFFVVLAGEVLFEAISEDGEVEVVAMAAPGALVGHIAAFTGRPASASARVDRETVVIAIPVARLTEAIRAAPELGAQLIFALAGREVLGTVQPEAADAEEMPAPTPPVDPIMDGLIAIEGDYSDAQFFTDVVTCPVSRTRFQYLRVRTRAVRPVGRDTDFHVRYEDVNPTWYGVIVCPSCGYAAYRDDFEGLKDEEIRGRLWEARGERTSETALPGHGLRRLDDAVRALELAMLCYEARDTSDSRRALLLHRRAWLARDGGIKEDEQMWLRRARVAYERAYESDTSVSEEAAARLAYLVGDLSYRLDDLAAAAQWLETAVRVAPAAQAGIARTARDRLQDVRDLIKRERQAS